VISRYRHYLGLREQGRLGWYGKEAMAQWLDGGILHFAEHAGDAEIRHQLHMFSASGSAEEAAENVLSCDAVLLTEDLAPGFERMTRQLGLELGLPRAKEASVDVEIHRREREALAQRLEAEYRMLDLVEAARSSGAANGR